MSSPCKGCTERICQSGEKCVADIAYKLAMEIMYDKRTKASIAARTHHDLLTAAADRRYRRHR